MRIPEVITTSSIFKSRMIEVQASVLSRGEGSEFVREIAVVADSVGIIALDDLQRILLIRQYRHALGQPVWEIPAGRIDVAGESPLQTAIRELGEETDMTARSFEELTEFANSVGWTTEKTYLFLATGLSSTAAFERHNEEADIEKEWIPLTQALEMVTKGELKDAKTIIAILLTAQRV